MTATTLDLALGVVIGDTPGALGHVRRRGVAAAIWRRPVPPCFAEWIEALPRERLPRLRAQVAAPATGSAVLAACAAAGTPAGPGRDWLADDAGTLAALLAQIAGAPVLNLRLEVIADDACRNFHLDEAEMRLLCTYRGRGTQYGAWALGRDPDPIAEVPRGAAALFRGALWKGRDYPGILHRSPPIAGTGTTRLLLVLEPAGRREARC